MAESCCLRLPDSIIADVYSETRQFHSSKVSFQKRFSSSDHLNVVTTNFNIYFDYIVAKTRHKNGHHKAILRLRACLLILEK